MQRGKIFIAAVTAVGGAWALALFVAHDRPSDPASAGPPADISSPGVADTLTVVELFTSQGCLSCPPAEAFLGRLIAQYDNVLGLEFHVTYWDDHIDGRRGRWRDRFSDPAFTERQRRYNIRLRGGAGIFTPQMVIGGALQTTGLARQEVLSALTVISGNASAAPSIDIAWSAEAGLVIQLDAAAPNAVEPAHDIWLVRFEDTHRTLVSAGENAGRLLTNHNVVRAMDHLGTWAGGARRIEAGRILLSPNHSCAVLIQGDDLGPILAATRCPDAPT